MEKETKYKIVIAILLALLIAVAAWTFLINYEITPKHSNLTGFQRFEQKYGR